MINIADNARPQVRTLLIAATLTVALWFIPFTEILTYPFRIFVTFIHEGGHALAALLTGNSVHALSVAMNASGATYTTRGNLISDFFVASGGYLGAMSYGALLLLLIRRAVAARRVLIGSAAIILTLTFAYGLSSLFTVAAGVTLASILLVTALYASPRLATFLVSFLAVQCVLNALFDLKTVLLLSSPLVGSDVLTDAANMANATGIPALFWALLWIGVAVLILSSTLRAYAVSRQQDKQQDLPFEDSPEL